MAGLDPHPLRGSELHRAVTAAHLQEDVRRAAVKREVPDIDRPFFQLFLAKSSGCCVACSRESFPLK